MGNILRKQREYELASLAFERALRLVDEKTLAALQGIARDYAQLLIEKGQARLAAELIERLVARYPERTELVSLLGTTMS